MPTDQRTLEFLLHVDVPVHMYTSTLQNSKYGINAMVSAGYYYIQASNR